MHKVCQGVNTTRPPATTDAPPQKQDIQHDLRIHTFHTDTIKHTVSPDRLKELMATDLLGRYPVTSKRGHKYLFVVYDYDANYIHATPIKSRKADELVRGFADS